MKNILATLLIVLTLTSCKTKQAVVSESNAEGVKSAKEIAEGHYTNAQDFKTMQIKAKAKYDDGDQSLSLDTDIRIKKDETILINISFLGLPVAKGLITPKKVSYYNKMDGTYFEGDFSGLTNLLKIDTELTYEKVQNIFLGKAMDNIGKGNYKVSLDEGMYKLIGKENKNIISEYLFEGSNYLLKQQQLTQNDGSQRNLKIGYPAYKEQGSSKYPTEVKIEATDGKKVNIDVEYKNITFDKEGLKFTYNVPDGLKQIFID